MAWRRVSSFVGSDSGLCSIQRLDHSTRLQAFNLRATRANAVQFKRTSIVRTLR